MTARRGLLGGRTSRALRAGRTSGASRPRRANRTSGASRPRRANRTGGTSRPRRAGRTRDTGRARWTSGPNVARRARGAAFTRRAGHALRARGALLAGGPCGAHLATFALRAGTTGHTLRSNRPLRPSRASLAARASRANRTTLTGRPNRAHRPRAARRVHQYRDQQGRGRRDHHIAIERVRRHPLLELVHITPVLYEPPKPRSARQVGRRRIRFYTHCMEPFWHNKSLEAMTRDEWESLCDGCGRCCLHKLREDRTEKLHFTNVACRLLDVTTARCSNYAQRRRFVPDCIQLTPQMLNEIDWLPPSCAYRLLQEGRDLPWWHPLVSGRAESVIEAGISVAGRVVTERDSGALEDHVVPWPGKLPRSAGPLTKRKKPK